MKVFTICITTYGGLLSSFVFEDSQSRDVWLANVFPKLKAKYKGITFTVTPLDGLKIGDKCKVIGEGSDIFTIEGMKKYSEDRYGFCLDSGWCEEVAKCYAVME